MFRHQIHDTSFDFVPSWCIFLSYLFDMPGNSKDSMPGWGGGQSFKNQQKFIMKLKKEKDDRYPGPWRRATTAGPPTLLPI